MIKKPRSAAAMKIAKIDDQKLSRLKHVTTKRYLEMREECATLPEFAETPDAWLARTLYRELRRRVQNDDWRILEQMADREQSLTGGPHPLVGQPFKLGLIVLLSDKLNYNRNRRMELSNAMEYAFRHNVPSKYFNGFVKQAGQKKIAKKLKAGHIEPGFTIR